LGIYPKVFTVTLTWPGNEVGLFYKASEPPRGVKLAHDDTNTPIYTVQNGMKYHHVRVHAI